MVNLLNLVLIFIDLSNSNYFFKLRKHGSRIRGHALTAIRPLVMNIFGFKRGSDAGVISLNQSLYASLKAESAFHYKVMNFVTIY